MSQTCPKCGARVPDGAQACPRCHASTEVTQKIAVGELSWCPVCGALLPRGAETCPKCGASVVSKPARRPVRNLDLPEIAETDDSDDAAAAARTGVMTRIESAIPPAADDASTAATRDRMPRPRAFAFAALFAVVLVGGAALLITHPWDPTASVTRASKPADTSMSGFPGLVESLTGQDDRDAEDVPVADAFDQIHSAYEQLGALEEEVEKSEDALREACASGDASSLSDGLDAARATSISVSNLISDSSLLDDEDGAYAEDLEHLQTLGNWLRNRCDILTDAWESAVDAQSLGDASESILRELRSASDYVRLFDENYDAWEPSRVE